MIYRMFYMLFYVVCFTKASVIRRLVISNEAAERNDLTYSSVHKPGICAPKYALLHRHVLTLIHASTAEVAFEKLTDMDYPGNTYYTIRNLTLYECQGWCREEPECQAASFRWVSSVRAGVAGSPSVRPPPSGGCANWQPFWQDDFFLN